MGNLFTTFTNCRQCVNGEIVEGERLVVSQDDGMILESTGYIGGEIVDLEDLIIAPGFLELHTNGLQGFHYSNFDAEKEYQAGIKKIAEAYPSRGITGFWATIPSVERSLYEEIIPCLKPKDFEHGASLLGAHVEGPWLQSEKRGAHDAIILSAVNRVDGAVATAESLYGGISVESKAIKLVTLAPELSHSEQFIRSLRSDTRLNQVRVSLGHSSASFEQGIEALSWGATGLTHVMNCMPPLHHRNPGLAGLISLPLTSKPPPPYYTVVCDGVHIHPSVASLLFKANPSRAILISDSIELAGLPDGVYPGNKQIKQNQRKSGSRVVIDGTDTLIGSCVTVDECVRNLVKWTDCSIAEAVKTVTENVADFMGLKDRGKLEEGRRADFVVLDDEGNVKETWIAGLKPHNDTTLASQLITQLGQSLGLLSAPSPSQWIVYAKQAYSSVESLFGLAPKPPPTLLARLNPLPLAELITAELQKPLQHILPSLLFTVLAVSFLLGYSLRKLAFSPKRLVDLRYAEKPHSLRSVHSASKSGLHSPDWLMSWFPGSSRLGSWGSRFGSPFTRAEEAQSPPEAESPFGADTDPSVTAKDFSYITAADIAKSKSKEDNRPSRESDAVILKHRKVSYPIHFPAYSIDDGILTVGRIRDAGAEKLGMSKADAGRLKLFYRGKTLKDDKKAAKSEGLKSAGASAEILMVVGEKLDAAPADEDEEDGEEDEASATPGGGKKKRRKNKKSKRGGKTSGQNSGTATPTSYREGTFNPDATFAAHAPPPPKQAPAPSAPKLQQTAVEKLESIASQFHTKLVPECVTFLSGGPEDAHKREFEHKRLTETILSQVLLKLDAVETDGDEVARAKRKALVKEVQGMLNRLDEVMK